MAATVMASFQSEVTDGVDIKTPSHAVAKKAIIEQASRTFRMGFLNGWYLICKHKATPNTRQASCACTRHRVSSM